MSQDDAQVVDCGNWLGGGVFHQHRKHSIYVLLATTSFCYTLVFPISGHQADILGI